MPNRGNEANFKAAWILSFPNDMPNRSNCVRFTCGAWLLLGLIVYAVGWWPRRVPDWLRSLLFELPAWTIRPGALLAIAVNIAVVVWLVRHFRAVKRVPASVFVFLVAQLLLWTSGIVASNSFDAQRSFAVLMLFCASGCAITEWWRRSDAILITRGVILSMALCSIAAVYLQYIVEMSLSG